MGVKGLWKLIESAGVPVPLETLEHKVLGVDVSIWLHQAVRGFRGPGGAAVANAHLLTLFHRICKLLFYRIRPIFVFDGGVPHLKKQTLASRKLKKEVATNKARQVRERLFKNLLKSQAVRTALGKSGPGPSSVHVPQVTKREKDLFELPPLSEALGEGTTEGQEEERNYSILECGSLPNLHHFDFESEEFKNMPLDTKHEILTELQDTRKQNSWATINDMPQQSENFAAFQMARLMKRAKFQATLDSTRDEIQKAKVSEMEVELFGDMEKYMSHSQRIISEDASHAIFVKRIKETNKSNLETVDEESHVPIKKVDRKGKAPMRKKKPIDKDFLTELAKVGVIRPASQDTDSDSDVESNNFRILHEGDEEDWHDSWQQCNNEEESFLQVVGSLMENSGLTQDEILTLIKQDQRENAVVECKNEIYDGPSTSANAPGNIFNPDDCSSDEDNFIEVSAEVQSPPAEKGGEEKEISANNIDKLLGTKTNSLWMKIVQQKVDDMVQVNTLKTSPNKAIIDSRKLEKENVNVKKHVTSKDESEMLKPVKISLDFEVKPLKMEDNIFSDIFTDIVCQPKSVKTSELIIKESQGSKQNIGSQDIVNTSVKPNLNCNSQTKIDYDVDRSVENKLGVASLPPETLSDRVCDANLPNNTSIKTFNLPNNTSIKTFCLDSAHTEYQTPLQNGGTRRSKTGNCDSLTYCGGGSDEGKLAPDEVEIMSSSDESDDEHNITVSTPQPSPHTETLDSHFSSRILPEHQNANTLQQMSNHKDDSTQSSQSTVFESKDIDNTETFLIKNTGNENKCADNIDLENFRAVVLNDQENNVEQVTLASQNSITQITKTTPVDPLKNFYIKHKNNTRNSQSLDSSSEDGYFIEVEGSGREAINKEGKKAIQEESKDPLHSPHYSDSSLETTKECKNISKEDTNPDVVNTTESVVDAEAKLYQDTDFEENRETNGTSEIIEVPKTEVEKPLDYTEDELKHLEGELASEQHVLVAQAQQCERLASSLNDQMYGESQQLLQLFGIPYLVAPMEAEAQCAFLNIANLTEGTITDDSDIFLFGANSVYRNFFNQTRHVESFKTENIKATLGLKRSKMITLALLCGSDYTEGLEGIGPVSAMEILAEFPGEGIECLQNLRKWWCVAHKGISTMQHSKIKQKLAQTNLPDSFPSESVVEAYMVPEVDESREKFTWAVPNVEALRVFTGEKFGWNSTKTDEILLPVMKKLKIKTSQKRIESYFTNIRLVKEPKVASKRMQDAITKAKGTLTPDPNHPTGQSFTQSEVRQKQKKRKVRKETTALKQVNEESKPSCHEVMADTKHSKPTKTLLIDPSESKSKPVIESRKGRKRKKDTGEDHNDLPQKGTERSELSQRKLTKEDIFKSLLEKEKICQKEKEKLEMQERKMNAANILHKQNKEKKIKKR